MVCVQNYKIYSSKRWGANFFNFNNVFVLVNSPHTHARDNMYRSDVSPNKNMYILVPTSLWYLICTYFLQCWYLVVFETTFH